MSGTAVKELYLLRHGDTGRTGRYIGSTDIGITAEGLQQVKKTGQLLADKNLEVVYCSPKLRCIQSLQSLTLSVEVVFDRNLVEIDFGAWEGTNFEEINRKDPKLVEDWLQHPDDFQFPRGESMADFRNRIELIARELKECKAQRILLISHGGVIRHLLCRLLNISHKHYLAFNVEAGCLASMQLFSEGGVLTGFNLKVC